MGCDLQSYRAVVGLFVSVLVEMLFRYASIAAKRARGAKVHSMASKFAVATLLAFLLMSGIEPNPGPVGEDNGIQSAIKQLQATFKSALQERRRQLNDIMKQQQQQSLNIMQSLQSGHHFLHTEIQRVYTQITHFSDAVEENREQIRSVTEDQCFTAERIQKFEYEIEKLESFST